MATGNRADLQLLYICVLVLVLVRLEMQGASPYYYNHLHRQFLRFYWMPFLLVLWNQRLLQKISGKEVGSSCPNVRDIFYTLYCSTLISCTRTFGRLPPSRFWRQQSLFLMDCTPSPYLTKYILIGSWRYSFTIFLSNPFIIGQRTENVSIR